MNFIGHLIKQGRQEILITTLDLRTINENSKVLVYGQDPYGYQRPIDSNHSLKIKDKALKMIKKEKEIISELDKKNEEEPEVIFPNSIILGINREDIADNIKSFGGYSNLVEVDLSESEILFRIIDGQHRINGLAMAAYEEKELWDLQLNVTILLVPSNRRVIELDVFEDINSTAKRLKMDLILLARQQYVLLGERELTDKSEVETYLAIKTSHYLNETIEKSVWKDAIKFEKAINNQIGIIGIAPFSKVIKPLVKKELNLEYNYTLEELDEIANRLAIYINEAWEIVRLKWKDCFNENIIYVNEEKYKVLYDSNYYLQKTTGVNAITKILEENKDIEVFRDIINKSNLTAKDWIKGGRMAGLTSGSGFKKAIQYIKNEENVN